MFIDSHCHFNFSCFDNERESILQKLAQHKIDKLVIPATEKSRWEGIQQLSNKHKNLYYALGIHPHFLATYQNNDLQVLTHLLKSRDMKCVAIGEIGLDKYAKADLLLQERVFIKQLQIAQELKLPIILHIVKQQSRVLQILKTEKFTQGGVYHAFSGSYEIALEFIQLGFKIGIGGVITYPKSVKTKKTISRLPLSSLLLETDAPDMPLYKQCQSDNTPCNLVLIFEALSRIRSEPKIYLAEQIYKNTQQIFLK